MVGNATVSSFFYRRCEEVSGYRSWRTVLFFCLEADDAEQVRSKTSVNEGENEGGQYRAGGIPPSFGEQRGDLCLMGKE